MLDVWAMRAFDIAEIAKGLFASTEQLPGRAPPVGVRSRACRRPNRVHGGRQMPRLFATW
jgi:hypothetical protein